MWRCLVCDQTSDDDTWQVCWSCGAPASVSDAEAKLLRMRREQEYGASKSAMEALPRWFHTLLRGVAVVVAGAVVMGAYWKGSWDSINKVREAEDGRGLRFAEADKQFLARLPIRPSTLVSGTYILETIIPGKPPNVRELNLVFVNGKFDHKPSTEPHNHGMEDTLVQNGSVVSWSVEGTGYLANTEWIGLIDGDQIWGRVYNWGPDDQIMGHWRMYRKPVEP